MLNKIKYPKFIFLFVTIIFAYILFYNRELSSLHFLFINLGYLGTFFAGILFVYGFTAAPATAILLISSQNQNILLACLTAGLGALLGDLVIFNFIRLTFSDEINKITEEKIFIWLHLKTPNLIKKYFIPVFSGILIASPLPDEIGVSLIASNFNISLKSFSIIAFLLNAFGIFIILFIGKSLI